LTGWAQGGCHCGAIRFEADPAKVFDAGICHCSICRRTSGAPMLAWALMDENGFRLLQGQPKRYRSSADCERLFCESCGCQLFYHQPYVVAGTGIHTATLDDPALLQFRPRLHMCVADRLPWVRISDELPEFQANHLTHPLERG
jgi:hypothetical protein